MAIAVLPLLFAPYAFAQDAAAAAAQPLLFGRIFQGLSGALANPTIIKTSAVGLLASLLALEAAQHGVSRLMRGTDDMATIVFGLVRIMIVAALFFSFVLYGPQFLDAIIGGFRWLAMQVTGIREFDPDALIRRGWELAVRIVGSIGVIDLLREPIVVISVVLAALCILVAYIVAAVQLLLAQIEAVVMLAASPMVFAFGGIKQLRDMSTKPFQHAITTGFKFLMVAILAVIMSGFGDHAAGVLTNTANIERDWGLIFELIATGVFLVILAMYMPTLANSMLSGAASMTASHAITGGTGMAAGAAVLTGGAAAAVGGAADSASAALRKIAGFVPSADDAISGTGARAHHGSDPVNGGGTLLGGAARDMALNAGRSLRDGARASFNGGPGETANGSRGGISFGRSPGDGSTPQASPNVGTGNAGASQTGPDGRVLPGAGNHGTRAHSPGSGVGDAPTAPPQSGGPGSGEQGEELNRRFRNLQGYIPMGQPSGSQGDISGAGQVEKRNVVSRVAGAVQGAAESVGSGVRNLKDLAQSMDDRTQVQAGPIDHRGHDA